jgi:hypothetical protein
MASDSLGLPAYERSLVAEVPPVDLARTEPDSLADGAATRGEIVVAPEDDGESLPAEGVYAPHRPRKVLLSEVVEFRTETLPRRKPRISGDESFQAIIDDE